MATATRSKRRIKMKKPTPLSTYSLAAFLTWKQFDLLLLLREEISSTAALADEIEKIQAYDQAHGGAFYRSATWNSIYSSLRTLERRQLVARHTARSGYIEWSITDRGLKALEVVE